MRKAADGNHSPNTDDFDINRGVSQNPENFFIFFIAFSDSQGSKTYPRIDQENI